MGIHDGIRFCDACGRSLSEGETLQLFRGLWLCPGCHAASELAARSMRPAPAPPPAKPEKPRSAFSWGLNAGCGVICALILAVLLAVSIPTCLVLTALSGGAGTARQTKAQRYGGERTAMPVLGARYLRQDMNPAGRHVLYFRIANYSKRDISRLRAVLVLRDGRGEVLERLTFPLEAPLAAGKSLEVGNSWPTIKVESLAYLIEQGDQVAVEVEPEDITWSDGLSHGF